MYHSIVRNKIRFLFDAINRGDAAPVVNGFAARFEHVFIGDHALGGTRRTVEATAEWYDRLYRLLPDIHFDLQRIDVQGMPWSTLAVVEWTETNCGTDGVKTSARGVHIAHIRWGEMTRLVIGHGARSLVCRCGRAPCAASRAGALSHGRRPRDKSAAMDAKCG